MFSSFFAKSKPINILLVAFLISIVFVLVKFDHISGNFSLYEILKQLGLLLTAIFSVFVLDFIIGKNNLTQKNSYAILLFGLFVTLIPESIAQTNLLLSNLFILFALRRLISLHSKLEIKKKLVDAAFWIGVASLFYFWSILFFILILIALLYYSQNDIKNWIIPFVALIVLALLVISYHIVFYDSYLPQENFYPGLSFDFSSFKTYQSIIKFLIIVVLLVIMSLFFIKTISEKTSKIKPSYILIVIASILAIVIEVIAPIKTGGELIFLFGPLAIMTATYLEKAQKKWVIDLLLVFLFLVSSTYLMLNFFTEG